MKDVFQLGNHLVWVTPSGTALVIDTSDGKEKLTDDEIDTLFVQEVTERCQLPKPGRHAAGLFHFPPAV